MPGALRFDPEVTYDCLGCGACCSADWAVQATDEEKARIEALPWEPAPAGPSFERAGPGLWKLGKRGVPSRCVFLDGDGRCAIHARFGADAKPEMCRRYPLQHVASEEAVWASASWGCPGVHRREGRPLSDHRDEIAARFAGPLAEVRAGTAVRYPLTTTLRLPDPGIEAAFQTVMARTSPDLFATLRQLAAFAASAPEPGEAEPPRRPADAAAVPAPLRYAFALTLYADAVDAGSFLGRLGGVLALPRMLAFQHTWRSRRLGIEVRLAEVLAHPGHLPTASGALLVRVLRSRLQSRQVFAHAPSAAAGITRALLEVDAILCFARALASGRAIAQADVLAALGAVERHISSQALAGNLARLDPRLRAAWGDAQVARAAAQLFTPEG